MSEYKIQEKRLKSIYDEKILKILLSYMTQHANETVSLHTISAFIGMSPSILKEKYLDTLCKDGLLQKYYLRDENAIYSINKSKLDENSSELMI